MSAARWSLALAYARRELRGGLKGFRVFVACLALGVAAIAGVQSLSVAVVEGLRAEGRVILGADVAARRLFQEPTPEQKAFFAAAGDASSIAELRAMARAPDGTSGLLELKAVDAAYPLAGAFELEGGGDLQDALAMRDGRWGVVVEDSALQRLGVAVGDPLSLGALTYEIRGVIAREPDRAASGAFILGPRAVAAMDSLGETRLIQPGSMVTWTERVALPPGSDLFAFRESVAAAFPDAGWRLRDATDAAPNVERFVDRMTAFLTLVGLTALLIGGVGVGNAVRAYLDGKVATIAALKCMGAPDRFVFRLYLAQILALTGVGIAIGLVVGSAIPPVAAWALADMLPVQAQVGFYPGALALAALFGLLTALVFSLWPLARARAIPGVALFRDVVAPQRARPRRADWLTPAVLAAGLASLAIAAAEDREFAAWFVGGAIVAFALFRGVAELAVMAARAAPRPRKPGLRLALANLHRPGNLTGTVLLSLGLGLTVLVAIALIEGNFNRQVAESLPEDAPAFFVLDIQPDQLEPFREAVTAIPGVRDLETAPSLRGRISKVRGVPAEEAIVGDGDRWVLRGDRGVTYAAELPESSQILEGEWWPADYQGPPLVSIYKDIAEVFALKPGETMTINILGRDIDVQVANVREIDWGTLGINFAIMLSPGVLDGAPQTHIATLKAPIEAESAVQRAVAENFPNVTAVPIRDVLKTVGDVIGDIGAAVRVVAGVTLVAGALVLAGAVAAGRRRRERDAVVLKVLGATRGDVMRAFLIEYGVVGLTAAAIASLFGAVVGWAVMTQVMEAEFTLLPSAIATTAVAALAVTLLVGFAGTWRALGRKAAPMLRNE